MFASRALLRVCSTHEAITLQPSRTNHAHGPALRNRVLHIIILARSRLLYRCCTRHLRGASPFPCRPSDSALTRAATGPRHSSSTVSSTFSSLISEENGRCSFSCTDGRQNTPCSLETWSGRRWMLAILIRSCSSNEVSSVSTYSLLSHILDAGMGFAAMVRV